MQFIFNLEEIVFVLLSDEVDSETQMTEATRATNSVKVGLRVPREIEVDDNIHWHDIDTTSEEVGTHKAAGLSTLEVVIDTVTVLLLHAGVNTEAWVAQLLDLFGKKLNSLGRITEDNSLVDVQLWE